MESFQGGTLHNVRMDLLFKVNICQAMQFWGWGKNCGGVGGVVICDDGK